MSVDNPTWTDGYKASMFEVKKPDPDLAEFALKEGTSHGSPDINTHNFGHVPADSQDQKKTVWVHNMSYTAWMDNWFADSNQGWCKADPHQGPVLKPRGVSVSPYIPEIIVKIPDLDNYYKSHSISYVTMVTAKIVFTANDLYSKPQQPAVKTPWDLTVKITLQPPTQKPKLVLYDEDGRYNFKKWKCIDEKTVKAGTVSGTQWYDFCISNDSTSGNKMTWKASQSSYYASLKYKNHTEHGSGNGVAPGGGASNKLYFNKGGTTPGDPYSTTVTVTDTTPGGDGTVKWFELTWTAK